MISDLVIFTPMYITLFWAVVLLTSKRNNNQAKHFLGYFMLAAFTLYLSHAVFFKKQFGVFVYFDSIYNMVALWVYPLYYWYIKLLTVDTTVKPKNLILLLPGLIIGVLTLGSYILLSEAEKQQYIQGFLYKNPAFTSQSPHLYFKKIIFYSGRVIFAIQVLYFLIHGIKLVKNYNNQIAEFYSNLENRTLVWVNLLLISLVVTSVFSSVFNVVGREIFVEKPQLLVIPSVLFSVLLFIIGILGQMQNHTVKQYILDDKEFKPTQLKNYKGEDLKIMLIELFKSEKLYTSPDLKITEVALKLQTNRTYISKLINTEFNCSFNDFVNGFRVKEAKHLLSRPENNNLSLVYISEQVGFGSVNTFIRVFKQNEGITPGKFREQNRAVK